MTKTVQRFVGSVEFSPHFSPPRRISHVLFDFDGTLSLIRQGWPDVMAPLFLEMLPRCAGETEDELRPLVMEDIMRLNGKQTIYQMIQLVERIRQRGGSPRERSGISTNIFAVLRNASATVSKVWAADG